MQGNEETITLLRAVRANDIETINKTINKNEELLNHFYAEENKTILLVACSENGVKAETVKALLHLNLNCRQFTKNNGWEALHWAASKSNDNILEILLKDSPDTIKSLDKDDNNALHVLISHGDPSSSSFRRCVEILCEKGINTNQKNCNNEYPIDCAKGKNIDAIRSRIQNRVDNNNMPTLMDYLREKNETQFISQVGSSDVNYKEGNHTLFQMCCKKNLKESAEYLLNIEADYEEENLSRKNSKPIIIAAENGFKDIFGKLLNRYTHISKIPIELLPTLIKHLDNINPESDHMGCYQELLEKLKMSDERDVSAKINASDETGKTALHYAIMYKKPNIIRDLLKLGASLVSKNNNSKMPIEYMDIEAIKNHLDACIVPSKNEKLSNEHFEVQLDFKTIVPPNQTSDEDNNERTEVTFFMSNKREFIPLLKHPVIESFLLTKWNQMKWFFFLNVALEVIFTLSLVNYILFAYACESLEKQSIIGNIIGTVSHIFLFSTLLVTRLIDVHQRRPFYKDFLKSYVRWYEKLNLLIILIELLLFLTTILIIMNISFNISTRKIISTISIILATFKLILLLGSLPCFSTYIMMLRIALYSIIEVRFLNIILIAAFALSFDIVFNVEPLATTCGFNSTLNNATMYFINGSSKFACSYYDNDADFKSSQILLPTNFGLVIAWSFFLFVLKLLYGIDSNTVSDTYVETTEPKLLGLVARAQYIYYAENTWMECIKLMRNYNEDFTTTTLNVYPNINMAFSSKAFLLDKDIARNIIMIVLEKEMIE